MFLFSFDDNGSISLSLIEARRTYWKQVASSFLKVEVYAKVCGAKTTTSLVF